MRTVTTETKLYRFNELSEHAKENARNLFRSYGDCWSWADEWWESAKAFSDIAPITINSADYDRGHVDITWTGDSEVAILTGLRAWKWLQNNGWFKWAIENAAGGCAMTGYCGDCPFADPLVQYMKNPQSVPDLEQVFYECAQSWVHEARDDMEYSYSDEAISELIEANEYEFTEEGKLQ